MQSSRKTFIFCDEQRDEQVDLSQKIIDGGIGTAKGSCMYEKQGIVNLEQRMGMYKL